MFHGALPDHLVYGNFPSEWPNASVNKISRATIIEHLLSVISSVPPHHTLTQKALPGLSSGPPGMLCATPGPTSSVMCTNKEAVSLGYGTKEFTVTLLDTCCQSYHLLCPSCPSAR